jgi:hypothetical protein
VKSRLHCHAMSSIAYAATAYCSLQLFSRAPPQLCAGRPLERVHQPAARGLRGPETAVSGCEAPRAPMQTRRTKPDSLQITRRPFKRPGRARTVARKTGCSHAQRSATSASTPGSIPSTADCNTITGFYADCNHGSTGVRWVYTACGAAVYPQRDSLTQRDGSPPGACGYQAALVRAGRTTERSIPRGEPGETSPSEWLKCRTTRTSGRPPWRFGRTAVSEIVLCPPPPAMCRTRESIAGVPSSRTVGRRVFRGHP